MAKIGYCRGDVYWVNLVKHSQSSIQFGYRPVVIVSSLIGCLSSDIIMVVPLSTKIKLHNCNAQVDFEVKPGVRSMALCNQITTISKNELGTYCGNIGLANLEIIERCVLISLGIAKPTADSIKLSQEALSQQKADREALQNLIPQAKDLVQKLNELISRQSPEKKVVKKNIRVKRTQEEIDEFMKEWADPYNNRNEVWPLYSFNSYNSAYQFYISHKKKEG